MRQILQKLVLGLAVLSGLYLFYVGLFPSSQSSMINKPAPVFSVTGPAGDYQLQSSKNAELVVVHIWATWCGPCRVELPLINQLYRETQNLKVRFVGLMEDEASDDEARLALLKNFSEQVPIEFPVYFDGDGVVADSYGTYQIPETYLINQEGIVIYKHEGPLTQWDLKGLKDLIQNTSSQIQ